MESFLNRCNKLREEYRTHGFMLSSSDLVIQVFSRIDATWRSSPGLPRDGATPVQSLPWEDVSFSLITEDSQRRQSSITSSTMLLPLGGSRGAHASQVDGATSGALDPTYAAAAAAGGPRPPPRGASPSRRVAQRRDATRGPGGATAPGQRVPSVCWICHAVGHEWRAFPDPRGRTPTDTSRAEVDRIRARLRAQMRTVPASAAVAGTPTPPSTSVAALPPGGVPPSDGRATAHL